MEKAMAFEDLKPLTFEPIGLYYGPQAHKQSSPRQAALSNEVQQGFIELLPQKNFEQALEDLEGFSHIWILFQFHYNQTWKPKVDPPISDGTKKGVFATRSPYRPNPIGLSAVPLIKVEGRSLYIGPNDLLDQTPILDLKPYLPYADSIPDARLGWTDVETPRFQIELSSTAEKQVQFLEELKQAFLRPTLHTQLQFEPLNTKKKRVQILEPNADQVFAELAVRTWRILFSVDEASRKVSIHKLSSGYSDFELQTEEDPYKDKKAHLLFKERFSRRRLHRLCP
jgi:tRNA-Thr(GGU) m(6)t(6)A37 methyltransferase TsaA